MSRDEWKRCFAANLDYWMKELGYSRLRLSEESGIGYFALTHYLLQETVPPADVAVTLARTLDIPVQVLIDFGEKIEKEVK